jgi:CelD/BcsL family acetyltransferase involved in cellulose biosynthesis
LSPALRPGCCFVQKGFLVDLTLYRDESGFAALKGEWNALLRRSRVDTIFLTREWQETWWRHLGASRGSLYLLAVREEDRLIAILPLYLAEEDGVRCLQVVGCIEVSDYLDLVIEAGREEAVYAAFFDWLAGPDAPAWDLIDLCNQPEASLAHTRLTELAAARGWDAQSAEEDVCPVVTLFQASSGDGDAGADAAWEAYLSGLDKKERHEIRRKLRRVEREAPDARVVIVEGDGPEMGLAAAVDRFIELHRLSSPAKDAFMTGGMQAFFEAIARALAERGWLKLFFLETGGAAAAAYFCFDYNEDLLIYNSGYDPQASPQLSLGWVLMATVIRHAISAGKARIDFLQGNEDYKYRFGGRDTAVFRTLIRKR